MLTEAFTGMEVSLKEYIRNLTETTAQKERIESELHRWTLTSEGIMGQVKAFSDGEPQSDDITMLILRFHGQGNQVNGAAH